MPTHIRPPLPENYKALCRLCREGRLFEVQEWFKFNTYKEPEKITSVSWPMGIAIEKGFHSLVETLLQKGIPADSRALSCAVRHRKFGLVELLFRYGARVDGIPFEDIASSGNKEIILHFIGRGADLFTGYPMARALIKHTRLFLGIYKSLIGEHPVLQFQAAIALRHFCKEGSMRGVSLLLWLGANPRTKVPAEADETEEQWDTSLMTAAWEAKLEVIKKLRPNPAIDDLNTLLQRGLYRQNMDCVRYWISLGADLNSMDESGRSNHYTVLLYVNWALESRSFLYLGTSNSDTKQFLRDWFSSGAKWTPNGEELSIGRKVFCQLSYFEALEFIKLLITKEVVTTDDLVKLLDTPKLRQHLKERRLAIVKLLPTLKNG